MCRWPASPISTRPWTPHSAPGRPGRRWAPQARGKILKKAADLLRERSEAIATLATMEEGKALAEARVELQIAAEIFDWYAEEGRRAYGRVLPQRSPGVRMTVVKEPVGPVAGFAPWNFPLGNPARKLGAALGAGCTVIVKPAEEAPGCALAIAQALVDAGVPNGVLAVVFGVPAEVSQHLIASPDHPRRARSRAPSRWASSSRRRPQPA